MMEHLQPNELPGPIELLDLEHGQTIQLSLDRHLLGTTDIHPTKVTPRHVRLHMEQRGLDAPPAPGTPITVTIPIMRVFGQRLDKPSQLHYWDISAKTLIADLEPRMLAKGTGPLVVTITANGYKPHKRYSVEQG